MSTQSHMVRMSEWSAVRFGRSVARNWSRAGVRQRLVAARRLVVGSACQSTGKSWRSLGHTVGRVTVTGDGCRYGMYFSGFVVAKQPTGCTCRICRNVCNSAGFSIRYVPASQNVSRPRNLGEMWAALSQFCTALGQVSTLLMPLNLQ